MPASRALSVAVVMLFASWAAAQATTAPAAKEPAKPAAAQTKPTPKEGPEAPASLWNWQKLTGDWGGVRTALGDKGVNFDVDVTQIIQGNAHGGRSTRNGFRYSGSADLTLTLNTAKMGLWPGGMFLFHSDVKWGDGIGEKVGALLPVNFDAVKPIYGRDRCIITLSEWIYFQSLLDNKLVLLAGKLDGSRGFDQNAFANDERTQFMNVALRNYPMIGQFLPYTNIGAGFIVTPVEWLRIATAVADSQGRADTTGFETTFHGPTHTTVLHEWGFKVKPFEKEGNYRVGFVWSSMEYPHFTPKTPFRQTGPLLMSVLGLDTMSKIAPLLPTAESPDNIALYANFDQWVWNESGDPQQGLGVFGRFGWARADVNPVEFFYSAGVSDTGLIPKRDKDVLGIGFFHASLSDNLPAVFAQETGVECYYSIEIAPWLHISPDLQIIVDPGGTDRYDTSIVYGIRMQANL